MYKHGGLGRLSWTYASWSASSTDREFLPNGCWRNREAALCKISRLVYQDAQGVLSTPGLAFNHSSGCCYERRVELRSCSAKHAETATRCTRVSCITLSKRTALFTMKLTWFAYCCFSDCDYTSDWILGVLLVGIWIIDWLYNWAAHRGHWRVIWSLLLVITVLLIWSPMKTQIEDSDNQKVLTIQILLLGLWTLRKLHAWAPWRRVGSRGNTVCESWGNRHSDEVSVLLPMISLFAS